MKRMRREGEGRTRRYWIGEVSWWDGMGLDGNGGAYVLVDAAETAGGAEVGVVGFAEVGTGVFEVEAAFGGEGVEGVVVFFLLVAVQAAAEVLDGVEFAEVEHFAEFLEFVFFRRGRFAVDDSIGTSSLRVEGVVFVVVVVGVALRVDVAPLLDYETLQGFEIGAVFDETADVDLGSDVVSDFASTVAEWRDH